MGKLFFIKINVNRVILLKPKVKVICREMFSSLCSFPGCADVTLSCRIWSLCETYLVKAHDLKIVHYGIFPLQVYNFMSN